jgi:hypothetical protein
MKKWSLLIVGLLSLLLMSNKNSTTTLCPTQSFPGTINVSWQNNTFMIPPSVACAAALPDFCNDQFNQNTGTLNTHWLRVNVKSLDSSCLFDEIYDLTTANQINCFPSSSGENVGEWNIVLPAGVDFEVEVILSGHCTDCLGNGNFDQNYIQMNSKKSYSANESFIDALDLMFVGMAGC